MTESRFATREAKALKIRRVLLDFLGSQVMEGARCLDIGCGNGRLTLHLADLFQMTIGVDRNLHLVLEGSRLSTELDVLQADGIRLPFPERSFDVVICAQVYEHMIGVEQLPAEVERVLRPGGLCFFSGPNKVWPIEPHYRLPFLHWLPQRLADAYVRVTGRGEGFDIRPHTAWHLRRSWRRFNVHDYTVAMLRDPERFGLSYPLRRFTRLIPACLLRVVYDFLPNYNWILVKPHA